MIAPPFETVNPDISPAGAGLAADIWSLGCTIIELLTGKPPYHDKDQFAALWQIVNNPKPPPFPPDISPELTNFLNEALVSKSLVLEL